MFDLRRDREGAYVLPSTHIGSTVAYLPWDERSGITASRRKRSLTVASQFSQIPRGNKPARSLTVASQFDQASHGNIRAQKRSGLAQSANPDLYCTD